MYFQRGVNNVGMIVIIITGTTRGTIPIIVAVVIVTVTIIVAVEITGRAINGDVQRGPSYRRRNRRRNEIAAMIRG